MGKKAEVWKGREELLCPDLLVIVASNEQMSFDLVFEDSELDYEMDIRNADIKFHAHELLKPRSNTKTPA